MSWQAYIDEQLMVVLPGGGQLSHAAIYGLDGGCWAQSADFPAPTDEEIAALVKGFTDSSQLAQVARGGGPARRQRLRQLGPGWSRLGVGGWPACMGS